MTTSTTTTKAFKLIKTLRKSGLTYTAIVKKFNTNKFKTTRGKRWTLGNVKSVYYKFTH